MFKPKITAHGWQAQIGSIVLGSQVGAENLPNLVHVHQVHGSNLVQANHLTPASLEADGLFSDQSELTLAVKTADCVPLHIWDGERICMVHAGWRGTKAGIVYKALTHFPQKGEVKVVMGPAICADHYEVGPDLYQPWLDEDKGLTSFLKTGRGDRKFLDLKGFIVSQLRKSGILFDQIFVLNLCTFDSKLPSYRREAENAARLFNYIRRIRSR